MPIKSAEELPYAHKKTPLTESGFTLGESTKSYLPLIEPNSGYDHMTSSGASKDMEALAGTASPKAQTDIIKEANETFFLRLN